MVLQILLGLAFIGSGLSKLFGAKMQVEVFNHLKLPQWFRLVTGIVQLIGAATFVIGIWLPLFAVFGSLWIGITMFFAIMSHVRVKDSVKQMISPMILMLISIIILILNYSSLVSFLS